MDIRIGVLAHYGAMETDFHTLSAETGCELIFRRGVLDHAVEPAVELEQQHDVHAILAVGRSISCISKYVSIPLVTLPRSPFNVVKAVIQAKQMGQKIAHVISTGTEDTFAYEDIEEIANCKVNLYYLDTADDAETVLQQIISDGCDVVVSSASCMVAKAKNRNIPHIQLKIARRDMLYAINTAKNMVRIRDAEVRRVGYMHSVVNASATATFTLDGSNRINIVNQNAEDILGMSEKSLVGHTLQDLAATSELFSQLINIKDEMDVVQLNQTELLVQKKSITSSDGRPMGLIYHFQDTKGVQQRELFVRKRTHEKGFVAEGTFDKILGHSTIIQDTIERARRYAATTSNILLHGESGSGKEIFAQSIHNRSQYSSGPFLAVNCATLPENLLESELFGYEEGAFTGAKRGGKAGLLEQAHSGTLFLDEIGEMPLSVQAKMLRSLQERTIRRISGEKNIPIDVRIISATNRDLRQEVANGNFRSDLFFRINVLSLTVPPLRKRKEDITDLATYFTKRLVTKNHQPFRFSSAAFAEMEQYDWPGNVRELQNFVERIVVLAEKNTASPDLVRKAMEEMDAQDFLPSPVADHPDCLHISPGSMKDMELDIYRQMLRRMGGDKRALERALDVSNTTIWRRLREI